jgi:hypothetical protein
MPQFIDRSGHRYGRLTVLSRDKSRGTGTFWLCCCDCGNHTIVSGANLGRCTHSCGCLHNERLTEHSSTHGKSKSLTYTRWSSMHGRCKRNSYYAHVKVCESWESFEAFLLDMGECPIGYSLERIDNAKNYESTNCIWIPKNEQSKNTSRCVRIEINGKTNILSEWCHIYGLNYSTVRVRLGRGWSVKEALELEPRTRNALNRRSVDL